MVEEDAKKSDKKEDDLKKQVSEMYTPLSVAKEEIWRRWNDKKLRKKVEDFLRGDLPEFFKREPKCSFFRFVTTPNFEFKLVYDLAKLVNLDLVFLEFLDDKFCTRNYDKLCLGKMVFSREKNSASRYMRNIIDIEESDNKPFRDIKTLWGEKFVEFHRRIFSKRYGAIDTFDVSKFKKNGESAYEVYLKVFSLFICNGVLFENYIEKDNHYEKKFTENVVLPTITKIKSIFGVKPLIIPLLPIREEESQEWMWYPSQIEDSIADFVKCDK